MSVKGKSSTENQMIHWFTAWDEKTLAETLNQRKESFPLHNKDTNTHTLLLTSAICFRDQQHGVENLIFILLIQDFALAEVGGELRRGDGAAQVIAFALHLLPQCIPIIRHPTSTVFHLSHPEE